jgi:hypothetical protein
LPQYYILNSSRHVYQTSISRWLHFMLLAEWAGKLDRDWRNIERPSGFHKSWLVTNLWAVRKVIGLLIYHPFWAFQRQPYLCSTETVVPRIVSITKTHQQPPFTMAIISWPSSRTTSPLYYCIKKKRKEQTLGAVIIMFSCLWCLFPLSWSALIWCVWCLNMDLTVLYTKTSTTVPDNRGILGAHRPLSGAHQPCADWLDKWHLAIVLIHPSQQGSSLWAVFLCCKQTLWANFWCEQFFWANSCSEKISFLQAVFLYCEQIFFALSNLCIDRNHVMSSYLDYK